MTRRDLLTTGLGAAAAAAGAPTLAAQQSGAGKRRLPLAVSTYSYWHFRGERTPIEKVIEEAAGIGFDGVEILHRQMAGESREYLNKLKRLAFEHGLALPMLSIHQDFVEPDAEKRREHIEHTKRTIDLAHQMGIPAIRLNSGRWGTSGSFDELMEKKGEEDPLPGYTDDDAFGWVIESIKQCLPHAEERGVVMAIENHWGLTTDPRNVVRIFEAVDSPWLGVNLDTGNYPGDPYEGIELLAPHAMIVQAKTYYGGGEWYTLDIDYDRVAEILRRHGFNGWISLEMEGKEPAESAVRKSYKLLREAFS